MREALGGLGLKPVIPRFAGERPQEYARRGGPLRHWTEVLDDRGIRRHSNIGWQKTALQGLWRTDQTCQQAHVRRIVAAEPVMRQSLIAQRITGYRVEAWGGPPDSPIAHVRN